MRRGTSSVDGNSLKDFLDTTTNNGAEWCRIQQFSYFSLSKFRSTAFQNTVDNCGNISMRQHLNVCLYQQRYTFFFFCLKFAVEQSCLVELCHAQPAQGNSKALRNYDDHTCSQASLLGLASS